jgi:SAM-dependent methyltransferase
VTRNRIARKGAEEMGQAHAEGWHLSAVVSRVHQFVRRQRGPVLRFVTPLLERARLLGPAWRLYERFVAAGASQSPADERGLAIPPPYLQMLVSGRISREAFLESGRASAARIREAFAEAGLDLDACSAVLDFGCGCGRIARWWPAEENTVWHGCDFNPRLAAWCAENLPHLHVAVNPLEPPTAYPTGSFDAVYAISTFTHWPEPLQHAWLAELLRLLRPGGRLLFTTSGEARRGVLTDEERARFDRGEFVARFGDEAGSNLCVAFHPPSWTHEWLLSGTDVLHHRPAGLKGQDLWVVSAEI